MSKETKITWEEIVSNPDKAFDEKMLPLMKEEVKSDFYDTVREGRKMVIELEKENFDELFGLPSSIDINKIADNELTIEAIEKKTVIIKKLYEELFEEEMK